MVRNSIHKKIIIKILIIVAMIVGSIVFSNTQNAEIKKLEKKEHSFKIRSNELESRYKNFDSRKSEIKEAFSTWLKLQKRDEGFEGLRISYIQEIFDVMEEKHQLNQLDINMSKPEILSGTYNAVNIGVQASEIRMRIKAYSDIQILFFIYDLLRSVPGYIDITSFSMKRDFVLNNTTYLKLAEDEFFSPVSAELIFVWHELKSK